MSLGPGRATLVLTPAIAVSKAHNVRRVAAPARGSVPGVRVGVLAGASHHAIPAALAGELNRLLHGFLRAQRSDL
jgi:hypothetical protein